VQVDLELENKITLLGMQLIVNLMELVVAVVAPWVLEVTVRRHVLTQVLPELFHLLQALVEPVSKYLESV
jgi:hypothetical protein